MPHWILMTYQIMFNYCESHTWVVYLICWLDSLNRFVELTHWFDSLTRFFVSSHWSVSLIRFLNSIHCVGPLNICMTPKMNTKRDIKMKIKHNTKTNAMPSTGMLKCRLKGHPVGHRNWTWKIIFVCACRNRSQSLLRQTICFPAAKLRQIHFNHYFFAARYENK